MDGVCFGKRVALFCPSFFGYELAITDALALKGAEVRLFDERPSNNVIFKALVRLGVGWLLSPFIYTYYAIVMLKLCFYKPNFIVFVNPESVPRRILGILKKQRYRPSIIVYMWDSFRNKPRAISYFDVVDRFLTFDPVDAEVFRVGFRPLFYSMKYQELASDGCNFKYDLCFMGTAHGKRSEIFDEIVGASGATRVFKYLYCPSPLVFIYKKYITRELSKLKYGEVSFTPLSSDEIVSKVKESRCIVDIPHFAQCGLTMRTIEALGAARKLITTSDDVLRYDFYREDNVFLFKAGTRNEIKKFLFTPYQAMDVDIITKYSLSCWVDSIMGDEEQNYFSPSD